MELLFFAPSLSKVLRSLFPWNTPSQFDAPKPSWSKRPVLEIQANFQCFENLNTGSQIWALKIQTFFPNNANIQNIITALTAKGKESGSNGPNKFILISCGGAPTHPPGPQPQAQTSSDSKRTEVITETLGPKPAAKDVNLRGQPGALPGQRWESCAGSEAAGCTLDNSLTNIQWLGKMSSDGLGSCTIKQEKEGKENRHLEQSQVKVEEHPGTSTSCQDSVSERPPYSYMAMIQFAINSTERKRMTLKDIYTWIEDHFPYFKHMAKPGWKNSIRHNLSLHDMFVRETSANGKVSFWTIHPSANRYLTLDQVFKVCVLVSSEWGQSWRWSYPSQKGNKLSLWWAYLIRAELETSQPIGDLHRVHRIKYSWQMPDDTLWC